MHAPATKALAATLLSSRTAYPDTRCGLLAGLFIQHRQANEFLASHGLRWDRLSAADKFRLHVVLQYDGSQASRFHAFAVRIQRPSAGTFNTVGEWFRPVPLVPPGDGVFTGECFVQEIYFNVLNRLPRTGLTRFGTTTPELAKVAAGGSPLTLINRAICILNRW
jgi:hypothetical protein